jgi:C2 domain
MLSFGKGSKKPEGGKKGGKELRRLLMVELVEARDLIACSSDATSDPYVIMSIAINDIDVKDEHTPQSAVKRKTIHPEWNEKYAFGTPLFLWSIAPLNAYVFMLQVSTLI